MLDRMPVAKRLLDLLLALILDAIAFVKLCFRSRAALAAENLFLRKQLAVSLERQVKPRRVTDATRLSLVFLSRLSEWRPVLTKSRTRAELPADSLFSEQFGHQRANTKRTLTLSGFLASHSLRACIRVRRAVGLLYVFTRPRVANIVPPLDRGSCVEHC